MVQSMDRPKYLNRRPDYPGKPGPIGWRPTENQRAEIRAMVLSGVALEAIGRVFGISVITLRRRCADELDRTVPHAIGQVGSAVYRRAVEGDVPAAKLFLQRHDRAWGGGATVTHEHGAPGGGPVRVEVQLVRPGQVLDGEVLEDAPRLPADK